MYKNGMPNNFSLKTSNRQEAKRRLEKKELEISGILISRLYEKWRTNRVMTVTDEIKITPYIKMVGYKIKMLIDFIGDIPAAEVDDKILNVWKVILIKEQSLTTMSIVFRSLSPVFSFGENQELIPKNPFKKIKIPKPPPRKDYFTEEELAKYYSVIDRPLFKKYFEFMVKTGIRPSEVRNFRWSDIHDDYMEFDGKEGKRIFPIWEEHNILFNEIKELQSSDQDDIFFCNEKGVSLVNHDRMGKLFKKYLRKSGIYDYKPRLVPYSLRHTFATLLLKDGIDIFDVSKLMGHKDVKTTQHNYDHITVMDIKKPNMKIFG